MKISSLGPFVATSPIEPSAAEKEGSTQNQNTATQPVKPTAKAQDSGKQDLAQGFVRFVDFVKKMRKAPAKGTKEDEQKRRRRLHAARAYQHTLRIEEGLSQIGRMLDKKK